MGCLSGHETLVDLRRAGDDNAVNGDALAWTHKNPVSDVQGGGGEQDDLAVLLDPMRDFGPERGEVACD
jgi:hypothetical protein